MPRTGRPRIPTALKLLRGNPGRRPIDPNEPKPAVRAPSCPRTVKGEARKEWRRVTKELLDMGVLTVADRAATATYCFYYAKFQEALAEMEKGAMVYKTGTGYPVITPWWRIAANAEEKMKSFWTEFGLTPASRTRIRVEKPKEVDAFETFRQQKKA